MSIELQKGLQLFVQDTMDSAVVKTFQDASVLASIIPMQPNKGSMVYIYDEVSELLMGENRELGQNISEYKTLKPVQHTEHLQIITNGTVIDRLYTNGALGNIIDIKAQHNTNMTTGVANTFCNQFYYGSGAGQLKGLETRLADGQGVAYASFDLATLSEAIDVLNYSNQGTKVLMMNAKTKREITALIKAEGYFPTTLEVAGRLCTVYNDVPIVVDNQVKDGEIFGVNFSVIDGVMGVTLEGLKYYEMLQDSLTKLAVDFTVGTAVKHPHAFFKMTKTAKAVAKIVKSK